MFLSPGCLNEATWRIPRIVDFDFNPTFLEVRDGLKELSECTDGAPILADDPSAVTLTAKDGQAHGPVDSNLFLDLQAFWLFEQCKDVFEK